MPDSATQPSSGTVRVPNTGVLNGDQVAGPSHQHSEPTSSTSAQTSRVRTAAGGGGGGGGGGDSDDDGNGHNNNNNNNNNTNNNNNNNNNRGSTNNNHTHRRRSNRLYRDARYRGMLRTNAALHYDPSNFTKFTDIGDLTVVCQHCNALRFPLERTGICCNNGKVSFPSPPATPDLLLQLFSGQHPLSQHFLKNIQQYNGIFKFTSFGANIQLMSDHQGNRAWTPNFKVLGQIYHRYSTIYIHDPDNFKSFLITEKIKLK